MTLKYEIPRVGESMSYSELSLYADHEGYEIKRIGNNENGELILVLSLGDMPAGMTFLLTNKDTKEPFTRVY